MPAPCVAVGRWWLGALAVFWWPVGRAGLEDVAVLEQQVRQLLDSGLASAGEERLRLLRAAVDGAVSELAAAPGDEAAFWDLRVRVADWGTFAARLVVSSWQTCRWTRAFPITADTMSSMGLDLPAVKTIRRCDGSTGISYHNCYFYDAATFSRLGIEVPALGYLVEDANWAEDVKAHNEPCEAPAEGPPAEDVGVPHPGRAAFPHGLGRWLSDRLAEKGLPAPRDPGRLAADAAAAMSKLSVCSEDVRGFFDSWAPPAGSQIIMVGCGTIEGGPTQPLIDAGMGGLFVDMRREEIVQARRNFGGPGRAIINATVSPSMLPDMLERQSRFVRQVEVVQVDIDNMDGPVLMTLLDFVSPSVIVVEVRHALPFPFIYACVECGMEEVALKGLGGANLGYWLHELGRRGYELRAMDRLDAVFVRLGAPRPLEARREHLLGTLACYLRNSLAVQRPKDLLDPLLAQRGPLDASPEALERIREEFSSLHSEFKFVLGV